MQQAKADISVFVIDHHISQWDVIPKDTVPVVYRWEAWLIIFREEHRLRIFENRMLRKISGQRGRLLQAEFRSDNVDDNILVHGFIIYCGNCKM